MGLLENYLLTSSESNSAEWSLVTDSGMRQTIELSSSMMVSENKYDQQQKCVELTAVVIISHQSTCCEALQVLWYDTRQSEPSNWLRMNIKHTSFIPRCDLYIGFVFCQVGISIYYCVEYPTSSTPSCG